MFEAFFFSFFFWKFKSGCNYLTSPLLELDFDEQNKANQRHDHEESQEDAHVEVFGGLLWERTTPSCQRSSACQLIGHQTSNWVQTKKEMPRRNHLLLETGEQMSGCDYD